MDIIKQLCLSKINDTVFCVRWGWEWYLAIDRTFFYSSYRTTLPSVDQVMGMSVFHSLIIIFWLNWWATHKRHILNIRVHKVWCIFFFLEEKLRRGLAKSYGSCILAFLWPCQIIFQYDCTILHPHYRVWEFQLIHILATVGIASLFSYFNRCLVVY